MRCAYAAESIICLIDPYQRHDSGLIPDAGATRELWGSGLCQIFTA